MIVYPDEDYDSWIDEYAADEYFETRLNADLWDTANKEAALITAFRSLNELDLTIDPTQSDQLKVVQEAQLEQVLHELRNDTEAPGISSLNLGGMLSVKIPENKTPSSRYSERALAICRPYITSRTAKRTR
jgi:hypothetical protein